MTVIARWECEDHGGNLPVRVFTAQDTPQCPICEQAMVEVEYVPLIDHREAVEEAEKWKRIAQDRCTCVKTCGDTPEDSGGICKELPRDRGQ